MSDLEVRHNSENERFESDVDGGMAFVAYIIDGNEITFTHTKVPKEAEGKGIAGSSSRPRWRMRARRSCV